MNEAMQEWFGKLNMRDHYLNAIKEFNKKFPEIRLDKMFGEISSHFFASGLAVQMDEAEIKRLITKDD